jgi:hypothetical protein
MPVAGGGFEQCYNAQAVVATESLLVIASWKRSSSAAARRPREKSSVDKAHAT